MAVTIPYGSRAVLISEKFVFICDRLLAKEDYPDEVALMAEVDRIYQDYARACNGE